jgi:Secretion system C-terminal sorting domain
MRKIYLVAVFALMISGVFGQCYIDSAARTTPGIYPAPDSIPCVVQGVPYDETIQVLCPTSFDSSLSILTFNFPVTVKVDSMRLDSIINLPYGLTWVKNPNVLQGGQNGCLTFNGITGDRTGVYNLLWYGMVWGTLPNPVPAPYNKQTYTGVLNRIPGFDYYLGVINQGDACPPANVAGISNIDLNAAVSIFPNPSNGIFEFKLDAASLITGDLIINDVTGRTIYARHINGQKFYQTSINLHQYARGLYTLELRTTNGFASKKLIID